MRDRRKIVGLASATLLAACALKDPPPQTELQTEGLPGVELPGAWQAGGAPGSVQTAWLATFDAPQLNALVSEALEHNTDLMAAAARVEQAAAVLQAAGARLLPTVDLLGRAGGKNSGDNSGLAGVMLAATWELDLWGRIRYGRRSAEEQYYSTQQDREYARQSIAAAVAKAYFTTIEFRLLRDLARAKAGEQTQIVSVAHEKANVGQGSEVDVATARADQLAYEDATLSAELALTEAIRAIEILVGRYPAAMLELADALPVLAPSPASGLPSELLERRPDVLAARHRVAAAFSLVEQAKTLRYPAFSLAGSLSHISSDLFVLERRDDIVASGGAKLYLPIFNNGEIKSEIEARTAEQKLALAQWAENGLRAFKEVESALANEATLSQREPLLAAQVSASQRAADLKRERYQVGTTDVQPVLDQQIRTFAAQEKLLRVQSERRIQRVNLFLALGGGFDEQSARAAASRASDADDPTQVATNR
jgi:NodT family efflux transporter outer membrane factor (OMF) lipoprotein